MLRRLLALLCVSLALSATARDGSPDPAIAVTDLPPEARGTIRGYKAYQALLQRADSYCQRNKLRCPVELTPQLIGLEGKRVEVVDRHGERRRFIVGKSTGWQPCHLEIARRNSSGGPAVTGAPFQSVRIVA